MDEKTRGPYFMKTGLGILFHLPKQSWWSACPCPCKNRRNRFRLEYDVVEDHLNLNGIDLSYRVWVLHGERRLQTSMEHPVVGNMEEINTEEEGLGIGNFVDAYMGHGIEIGGNEPPLCSPRTRLGSDLSDDQLRTRLGHMSSTPCQVIFSMADELCRALGGAEKVEIEWGNHSLSNRVEEAVKELKGSIRLLQSATHASMLEIYNETIRDLLSTNRAGSVDNSTAATTTMSSNQSSDVDSIADDPMDAVPTKGLTETCSPTLLTTGNPCLDFFFHILPDTPSQDLIQRLELAWTHNPLTALKLVSHLCGVRGTGKSDKQGFYAAALWLHEHHPKTLALNVRWFAESGYLKGLLEILYRILERLDVEKVAKE
ncbi:hypothetical protein IFM89_033472 [Coptis chinensis]|uniref:Uncharacterized protein n=1 Tax=Coptis chinensis TaxID=261450 RepID=A0A835HUL4_9MAGN|nr:hypothetical protein IFM89_033472 [Coptis chinensis]